MEDRSKIHRLLRMITLIQGQDGWNAPRLADEFGVDVRTIYRDIKDLEASGLPCEHDREHNGYRAKEGVFLQPVQLSVQEALSLAVLCDEVAAEESIPYLGAACQAIEKLRNLLPTATRGEIDLMMNGVRIKTAVGSEAGQARDVYEMMVGAIRDSQAVLCEYESLSNSRAFTFHPYALFFGVRAWYVIGFHVMHNDMRTLRLNRFNSVKRSEERFERPVDFSVDDYLGNAWRMMRGESDHEVEIVFDPEFAQTIADTMWHKTQELEELPDGSVIFRCRVSGLDEIVWWILSMGPHCEVKEPAELAERVATLAQETAKLYGKKA